jgi:hypothetical protein
MLFGTCGIPKVRNKSQDSCSVGVCNINACIKETIEKKKRLLLGFGEEIICPLNTKDAYLDVCANEMVLYNFTQKKNYLYKCILKSN